MAEMEVKGGKKGSPRVDLTPMVDLGFLLITFFMFTTTMTKPKAMDIQMPYKDNKTKLPDDQSTQIKNSVALTILLSKDHRIYYYEGMGTDPNSPPDVKVTTFENSGGIRQVIIDKKKKVESMVAQGINGLTATDKTTVLIKPDSNCTTKDLIGILDEMTINAIPVYAVVDITPVDQEFIKKTETANGE